MSARLLITTADLRQKILTAGLALHARGEKVTRKAIINEGNLRGDSIRISTLFRELVLSARLPHHAMGTFNNPGGAKKRIDAPPKPPWEPAWVRGWHSGLAISLAVEVESVRSYRAAWKRMEVFPIDHFTRSNRPPSFNKTRISHQKRLEA